VGTWELRSTGGGAVVEGDGGGGGARRGGKEDFSVASAPYGSGETEEGRVKII
jgi:hypothetical protein